MVQTLSEENYLKAIYHLEKQGNGKVSATAIADELTNFRNRYAQKTF